DSGSVVVVHDRGDPAAVRRGVDDAADGQGERSERLNGTRMSAELLHPHPTATGKVIHVPHQSAVHRLVAAPLAALGRRGPDYAGCAAGAARPGPGGAGRVAVPLRDAPDP